MNPPFRNIPLEDKEFRAFIHQIPSPAGQQLPTGMKILCNSGCPCRAKQAPMIAVFSSSRETKRQVQVLWVGNWQSAGKCLKLQLRWVTIQGRASTMPAIICVRLYEKAERDRGREEVSS